jgi:MFS transporter, FSR family, fosmidomycin resistance protein
VGATRRTFKAVSSNPIFSLSFLHILNDGWLASLPLLLPFIQKDLNIEFGQIGLLTSILSVAGVVLAIPAASISKRFGGFRILVCAAAIYSCAFILTGFSSGFLFLALSFILASVGFGIFHPVSFALIAHVGAPERLGAQMGSFTAVGDIGRIGVAACVTLLVSWLNWRDAAIIFGCIPLVLVFAMVMMTKKNAIWTVAGGKSEKVHGLHCNTRFIFAIASGCIDSLASSSLFVFIPFLYLYRGASTALLGSLSGAFFVGNMLGKVASGKITDRLGSHRTFIFSETLMAGLLIGLCSAKSVALIAAISIALGAVTKGTVPVINTIITESVADKRLYDKAFGIGSFANGIAAVIAPLLYGLIIDKHGILTVFWLSACFALAATLPLLAGLVIDKRRMRR